MRASILCFVALAACSSKETSTSVSDSGSEVSDSTAGDLDTGPDVHTDADDCPSIAPASGCPAGCSPEGAQRIDRASKCLGSSEVTQCLAPGVGCTAALTCLTRESDGASFWFGGDCHRPGWRVCTDAEKAGTNWDSAKCSAEDAGPG